MGSALKVDARPGNGNAQQSQSHACNSWASLQREAEGNRPPQRQVIAWERRIGNMRDEGVTQADHERSRMQPSQADDLVDEQAQQSRCASVLSQK